MNLFIDYFTDEEREGKQYIDAIKSIKDSDVHHRVDNKVEFLNIINERDLNGISHVTILTHGVNKTDFLCKDGVKNNFISYSELLVLLKFNN